MVLLGIVAFRSGRRAFRKLGRLRTTSEQHDAGVARSGTARQVDSSRRNQGDQEEYKGRSRKKGRQGGWAMRCSKVMRLRVFEGKKVRREGGTSNHAGLRKDGLCGVDPRR